jgi:hypothetical protein
MDIGQRRLTQAAPPKQAPQQLHKDSNRLPFVVKIADGSTGTARSLFRKRIIVSSCSHVNLEMMGVTASAKSVFRASFLTFSAYVV